MIMLYGYLCKKILITKKALIRWGINPIFFYKTMSDNKHYVNLMLYKLINTLKVVDCPYFRGFFQKISRATPLPAMGNPRVPKIQKSLIINIFRRVFQERVLDSSSILCKPVIETVLRIERLSGGRVVGAEVRSLSILGVRYA